jgi:hypothetical protein
MTRKSTAAMKRLAFGIGLVALAAAAAYGERGDSLSSTRTVTVQAEGRDVPLSLNDRAATFAVSAPARSAVKVKAGTTISTKIYPSFAAVEGDLLPSLELARWKGLAFEEGALAAVEAKLEESGGDLGSGKGGFLGGLAIKLGRAYQAEDRPAPRVAFADAQAFIATAIALSRADGKVPAELGLSDEVASKANQDKDRFLKEELAARLPAGRYGWSEGLKRIYLSELWLAKPFERADEAQFKAAVALTWAVGDDPVIAKEYGFLSGLFGALVGSPPGSVSVAEYKTLLRGRDPLIVLKEVGTLRTLQVEAKERGDAFVFLPAPRFRDAELLRRFAATESVGGGTWAEAYEAAVRSGKVGGKAAAGAPWLDFAAYAWAALLTPESAPEAAKLTWDDGYKKRLAESYATGFDQTRGRAAPTPPGGGTAEAVAVEVEPEFRLEPLPEYYLRAARAYGRLGDVLESSLGASTLETMRGSREGGAAEAESLAAEAAGLDRLFYGLYLLSCADVGITPALRYGEVPNTAEAAKEAYTWLETWRSDKDMARDLREAWLLGPGDPSAPAKGNVYRCVLGVRIIDVEVKYDRKPSISLRGTAGTVNLGFKPAAYAVAVPVVVEVAVPGDKPLTRAQFRAICDKHKTEGAIVAALKDFGKPEEVPPEEAPARPEGEVDTGMVVLIVLLAVFAFIIVVALIASRQRY